MTAAALSAAIATQWDDEIVPQLIEYIRIPAKSPHFDPAVGGERSHRARDPRLPRRGCASSRCAGSTSRSCACPGRTPLLYFDVPATEAGARDATVLLYGHLDKQPEMIGLARGLGPWDPLHRGRQALRPRRRRRWLRGVRVARRHRRAAGAGRRARALRRPDRDLRGERQLRSAGVPRSAGAAPGQRRFRRRPRFGLRRLRAAVGDDVAARTRRRHADGRSADRGRAFGRRERHRAVVVPHRARTCSTGSRTRATGRILPAEFHAADSRGAHRRRRAQPPTIHGRRRRDASIRSPAARKPMVADRAEALLNRTWRPALSIVGADGLPSIANAGNVLRPRTVAQAFAAHAADGRRRHARRAI